MRRRWCGWTGPQGRAISATLLLSGGAVIVTVALTMGASGGVGASSETPAARSQGPTVDAVITRLEAHHARVLYWIETVPLEVDRPYLGPGGARERALLQRFGSSGLRSASTRHAAMPPRPWWSGAIDGTVVAASDVVAHRADVLGRDLEWALWTRYAELRAIDPRALSTFVRESRWDLGDPWVTYDVNFGRRFPADASDSIRDVTLAARRPTPTVFPRDVLSGAIAGVRGSGWERRGCCFGQFDRRCDRCGEDLPHQLPDGVSLDAVVGNAAVGYAVVRWPSSRGRIQRQVVEVGSRLGSLNDEWVVTSIDPARGRISFRRASGGCAVEVSQSARLE